ncbi:hypothetical protein BCV69DRAFT_302307, partial [Microstroma glucosiphilum]
APNRSSELVNELDAREELGRRTGNSTRVAREAEDAVGRPFEVEIAMTIQPMVKQTTPQGLVKDKKLKHYRHFVRFKPLVSYLNFTIAIAKGIDPATGTPEEDYKTAQPHFCIPRSKRFDQYIAINSQQDYEYFLDALKSSKWVNARGQWEVWRAPEVAPSADDSDVEVVSAAKKSRQPAVTPLERSLPLDDTIPEVNELTRKWPVCTHPLCRDYVIERWALDIRMPGSRYTTTNPPSHVLDDLPIPRFVPPRKDATRHRSRPSIASSAQSARESTPSIVCDEELSSWPSSMTSSHSTSDTRRSLADITNLADSRRIVSDGALGSQAAAAAMQPRATKDNLTGPYMSCLDLSREGHMWQDDDLLIKLANVSIFDMHTLADIWHCDKLPQLHFGLVDCSRIEQMLRAWHAIPDAAPNEAQTLKAQRMRMIAPDKKEMQRMAGLLREPTPPTAAAAQNHPLEDSQQT